jgi:predicted O-linked N-acetylglucosamine transferase (SPINDLY family)
MNLRKIVNLIVLAIFSLASCMCIPPSVMAATPLNYVAIAGKQRMLSQRVLKAYAQVALGLTPERSPAILSSSLAELRTNYVLLRGQSNGIDLARLQAQEKIINRLAALTALPTTAETVKQTFEITEELLANAEQVTQAVIKSAAEAQSALVNLAAKQRMLSQRAAAAYLVYQIVPRTPELKALALKAAADFNATIKAFEDAKTEFPQITEQIDASKLQMIFFQNALSNMDSPSPRQFTTVATSSERVLSEMDAMTAEIVKQLANQGSGK